MAWAPNYVAVDTLAAYLRVDDEIDDAELGLAITAASRAIDHHCNRQFGQVDQAEERLYTARYDYEACRWVVDIDDLGDDTGLVVEVDGEAVATYVLEPVNAVVKGRVWTRVAFTEDSEAQPTGKRHEVAVTALWGWPAVPEPVEEATLLQGSRFNARRNAPFGVAGSPEVGSEMRLLHRVDPDVAVVLRRYKRPRSVA